MYRKLSAHEISAVVAKIRKKYEEYCSKFFKSRRVREQFEDRYMNILRQGLDISNFLLAEISAIDELIKIEERKIEQAPVMAGGAAPKKAGFADKIIEENMRKIEKYTAISIHKDSNPEVKRLLGALNRLYEQYLPVLQSVLRRSNSNTREITVLENKLRQLGYLGSEQVSSALAHYYTLINHFPRDYRAVEREEKDYILEAAFLLHDLCSLLETVKARNPHMDAKYKAEFDAIYEYVKGIINDFRLKDLKRKK